MHVLGCHVEQWLDKNPVGLAVYCEQTSEAAHKDFQKTLKRFAVAEFNPQHAAKLLKASVDYNSKHM